MKIVVCYKNVPNTDSIQINKDLSLNFSESAWEIGQYDMNAIEAAMAVAGHVPESQVIALTAAGQIIDNTKQKKAVLSRGPQKMVGVKDERLDSADAFTVAKTLAAAIEKIGDVDLVLFGEGSGDAYAQQTGVLTGAILGWNTINAVKSIDFNDGELMVLRSAPASDEELLVKLPAAISVTADINKPRIPTLKNIMGAGKKPLEVLNVQELGLDIQSEVKTVSVLASAQKERKQVVYENPSDENFAEIAKLIRG